MKKMMLLMMIIGSWMASCDSAQKPVASNADKPVLAENDTIRISSKDAEFDIIILDPSFNSWFNMNARPRQFYTQNHLEQRNIVWVSEWNSRAMQPSRYGAIYDMPINYEAGKDYGFEVNYMLYNYLTYFQLKYRQNFGGFVPRI